MPYPAYMRFTFDGTVMESDLSVCGEDNLYEILEYSHSIGSHETFSPFTGSEWNVTHSPVRVVMNINKMLPHLYRLKCECDRLYYDQIEIFWLHYDPNSSKDSIYFKHTLHPVKVWKVRQFYPNVKTQEFEQVGHLVELEFRYRFISALFLKGYLKSGEHEWKMFLGEFAKGTDLSPEEVEYMLTCPVDLCATDFERWEEEDRQKNIRLFNPKWIHTTQQHRDESPNAVAEGDKIKMTAETQEMDEGKIINFRVTSKGEQQTQCLAFIESKNSGDKASAEWTVDLSNLKVKEDVKLTFNAEGAGLKTKEVDIPFEQEGWGTIESLDGEMVPSFVFTIYDEEDNELSSEYTNDNGLIPAPFGRTEGHTILFRSMDTEE